MLGAVRQEGTAHGYQVRRLLTDWWAEEWAAVSPGSIYQALRTATKHGLLEPVGTESGGGPERTVYRITPDGETEFLHLVRRAVMEPDAPEEALNAAFAFLSALRRSEFGDLLALRARELNRVVARSEDVGEREATQLGPPQVCALVDRHTARARADLAWSRSLVEQVREGAFRFADDAPEAPEDSN